MIKIENINNKETLDKIKNINSKNIKLLYIKQ